MARNVEIKARIESVGSMIPRVAAIADGGPVDIEQDDTFFACEAGRLKLRELSATAGELIFYRRVDDRGPKESFYVCSPTSSPRTLRESLALAYGVAGRVQKQRTLFMVGRTRVHLDRVTGLGDFLELEVVLDDGEASEVGANEAATLMARLGIAPAQLIERAYVDLLAQRASSPAGVAGTSAARAPHPRFPVAVHLFLLRGDEVLLLRRCNTGFEDGKLSVVAGHVEPGESATRAAIREAAEEVGVTLAPERLRVVGTMHRNAGRGRVDFFLAYTLDADSGEPANHEPDKCSELVWTPLAKLPEDTIPYVRAGLDGFRRGTWFQEFGWETAG